MKIVCARCGGEMTMGQLNETLLSFIVSSGTPTSSNPVTAVFQGMRGEPDYQEQVLPVRARACSNCGFVEFCLDPDDAKQLARGE